MKWYKETTSDFPAHTYLLDAHKRRCYAYIKVGTRDVMSFTKPLKFDPKHRTFKEIA